MARTRGEEKRKSIHAQIEDLFYCVCQNTIRKTHILRYMEYGQKCKYSEELRITDKDVRKEAINLKVSTELNKENK